MAPSPSRPSSAPSPSPSATSPYALSGAASSSPPLWGSSVLSLPPPRKPSSVSRSRVIISRGALLFFVGLCGARRSSSPGRFIQGRGFRCRLRGWRLCFWCLAWFCLCFLLEGRIRLVSLLTGNKRPPFPPHPHPLQNPKPHKTEQSNPPLSQHKP